VQRSVIVGLALAFVAAGVVAAALVTLSRRDAVPRDDPAAFVTRIVTLVVADDYGVAWGSLYPPHQLVAPRREYVDCELRSPVGASLRSIDVLRVADRSLRIPGQSTLVDAKAVTLRVHIENTALRTHDAFRHTFNAVPVGSHWAWILTPSRYELYRADACGGPA
jgi:hypothetical protein